MFDNELTAFPDGDCLTGSGAQARAEFDLTAPDVTTANEQVLQSLQAIPQTDAQTFTAGSEGRSDRISFVSTRVQGYEVEYYLQTPIMCSDFGTPGCRTDAAAAQTHNYIQKPVSKVRLTLSGLVQ